MEIFKHAITLVYAGAILSLASCGSFRNVSSSNPIYKEVIGKTVCSKGDLHIQRRRRGDVHYFDLEEFILSSGLAKSQQRSVKTVDDFVIPPGAYSSSVLVKNGTRFKIEKVYFYNMIFHSGHIVMASVTDLPVGTKLVKVSMFFEYHSPFELISEFGEYC